MLSRHNYLSFNAMKYHMKLKSLTKLNKNAYKKIKFTFILIDFCIKLSTGF